MRFYLILLAASFFAGCSMEKPGAKVEYPESRKTDVADNYFGTKVADPYRWLEEEDSEDTKRWVEEQNKITFDYLKKIPFRDKIKARLTELWNYPKVFAPFKAGEYYLYYKNDGLQNQSVLYIKKGLEGKEEVFLDPNTFSTDGTVAINSQSASNDGRYLAFSISRSGSDWNEIIIKEFATGKTLADTVKGVKFSNIAWHKDGFFYSAYERPDEHAFFSKNEFHKIFYHKLNTDQKEDLLVYEDKDHPLRNFYAETTEDDRYLMIMGSEGTSGNNVILKDLQTNKFIPVVDDFKNDHYFAGSYNGYLYFLTNLDAGNKKVVRFKPESPNPSKWETVLPEKEYLMESADIAGNALLVSYLKDASARLWHFTPDGKDGKEIALPEPGDVNAFVGGNDQEDIFFRLTSFTNPGTVFRYNLPKRELTKYVEPELNFDPSMFTSRQVFYKSKDGEAIPMFIVHKKGVELNGQNPAYLYGYGGFDISLTPVFTPHMILWLENGGIYAQPSLRGGGEYGQRWHEAGMLLNKQNVFDDFIAAAEYLISEGYTNKDLLAIEGRSNGGLLVGAAMTQRPDLFRVALPGVGVIDMLRYHHFTIGWAWAVEYGSSDDSIHFQNLYSYSPLHNIKEGTAYPATLITTADHDDRVAPAHSFKFAATLQEKHAGEAPVLIRIDTKAGHGAGKPVSKQIEEWADKYAFTFYNMGLEFRN